MFVCIFLPSCSNKDKDRLTTALQVLEERPDSAYILLKSIDYNSLDTERDKAEYILARAKANLYNGRSLMTDTMLNQSIIFFKNAGDTTS
ncbi:MAG: hypothetical protein K2H47_07520, partial [Muribaculaceae bacterium]|nr:hypothetical protein [Muribaculaceae bacterium]